MTDFQRACALSDLPDEGAFGVGAGLEHFQLAHGRRRRRRFARR